MELGLEKLLGAQLDKQGTQMWARIPVGQPSDIDPSEFGVLPTLFNRSIVVLWRSVMTFRGKSYADWSAHSVQGPYIPKVGREKFRAEATGHAMESEELLDALVEAQKKTKGMTDGKQIASVFNEAFKAAQAAYKANHPEE